MNWFERYGIVGMSFYLFLGILLFFSCTDIFCICKADLWLKINGNFVPSKVAGGIIAFTFLPIGYLIMIISQLLYYSVFGCAWIKKGTHQKIFNELPIKRLTKIYKKYPSEAEIEAILTYQDRMKIDKEKLENMKFLAPFITKRFDVIAINKGLILSYISAWIIVAFIGNNVSCKFIFLSLVLLLVLFTCLSLLNNCFEKQIVQIEKKVLKKIKP